MVMSTTPSLLTAPKCYWRLDGMRRRRRGRRSSRAPRLAGQIAGKPEDDQRVQPVQDADGVHGPADPCQHDLNRHGNGHREREENASLPGPRGQGEQQQQDGAEEDEIAESSVEAEAVVERLLADHLALVRATLVAELLRRVETAVRGTRDLSDDRQEDQRDPVAIKRSECLHW